MLRTASVIVLLILAALSGAVSAQSSDTDKREQERIERRQKREQEGQKRMQALFQANRPPKGTATVVGRSFVYSVNNGFGNSIALLEGSTNKDLQKELNLQQEQIDKLNVLRSEVQIALPLNAMKYAGRFKTMTDADREGIQKDIMADLQKITDRTDEVITPEQKGNARRLIFQATGGLDSPIVNLDSMSVLKLSDAQKEQAAAALKELEKERLASLEEGLNLAEKFFDMGGASMSPEQRAAFEAEVKSLEIKSAALGRKVGGELRKLLTDEQRALEENLLANRPKFLPPLPRAMRGDFSRPEIVPLDSWKPGQGALNDQSEEKKSRRPFPTSEK
ncbi:MAG: hypothetical protein LBN39_07715 [Planctomycetaceae bacterium]|jgi:hypothetical protein|nr:hypothetical protein [Planctomycetaceae bacterium]